jgi:6,7-dimethyl-8-ribityllumazine synthase
MADSPAHVLVVEARYYEDISEELALGAIAALDETGCTYDRIEVAGALEIPAAIAIAHAGAVAYDGYVALGCVIRGETSHYDIVAGESARALMDLAVGHRLAIGNGILTVETSAQALARARVAERNKGGFAASACLDMIALKRRLTGEAGE